MATSLSSLALVQSMFQSNVIRAHYCLHLSGNDSTGLNKVQLHDRTNHHKSRPNAQVSAAGPRDGYPSWLLINCWVYDWINKTFSLWRLLVCVYCRHVPQKDSNALLKNKVSCSHKGWLLSLSIVTDSVKPVSAVRQASALLHFELNHSGRACV